LWGADLPVTAAAILSIAVRFDFYRDRYFAFEGFTVRSYLFLEEFTSRSGTPLRFPGDHRCRVKRELLPDERRRRACWFINTRREKFRDPTGCAALGNAFVSSWTTSHHVGAYLRTSSPFQRFGYDGDRTAVAEDVACLSHSASSADEVFCQPFRAAGVGWVGADRTLLRQACSCFRTVRLRD